MKTNWIMTLLTIIILATLLAGCSHNKPVVPAVDPNVLPAGPTTIYPLLDVPAWVLYPADTFSVIGLAVTDIKHPSKALESAREFARQSIALNNCSFDFNSADAVRQIDQLNNPVSSFYLSVTFEPGSTVPAPNDETKTTLAETKIQGYNVVLFGPQPTKVNQDIVEISAAGMPNWGYSGITAEDSQYIYTVGRAENPSLTDAWQLAQKDALRRLCLKRLDNLKTAIQATADSTARITLANTAKQTAKAEFNKQWMFQTITDGKTTYSVALMLKSKK